MGLGPIKKEKGAMKQTILPLVPKGSTPINSWVSVWSEPSHWTYFLGTHPIYKHPAGNLRLFRLTMAQLIDSGACRACEVIKTFGVSKSSVDRALRCYRTKGLEGFFVRKGSSREGTIMTCEVLAEAQGLLDGKLPKAAVAQTLGVHTDTLRRAVWDGRLHEVLESSWSSVKSERTVADAVAAQEMGTGCTRTGERVLAALGKLNGATVRFKCCRDVPYGGVLCALPALLINGLLSGVQQCLGRLHGYYSAVQVLLLLAFMALSRIKTVEQLRGKAPGELGKLMGLDRIPEVRCLRAKMKQLSKDEAAEKWGTYLSRQWMEADPQAVGTLYVDGHVRVYHGTKSPLPRKYVTRQRLCLRGTTDYWVNDSLGRPFFVIDKVADPGLLQTLRETIVPRLLREVPAQPTQEQLHKDPFRCRFILVFDREAYSPAFFKEMWQKHRIACLSYHKYPASAWPEASFTETTVSMPNAETVTMKLCERGSLVGSGTAALWMKEIRKLTDSGHQTSLISTAYGLESPDLAAGMFSRWCQENFFRYMMQHFAIDLLSEYSFEPLHDTEKVVNPAWRQLNRERQTLQSKLRYRQARFAALTLHPVAEAKPFAHKKWEKRKAQLLEVIEHYEQELSQIKAKRKETNQHIHWEQLDKQERFDKPILESKRLLDTIRMIAYRAETAICGLIRSPPIDLPAARRILQDLFVTEADIHPQAEAKRLWVRVHRSARPAVDRALIDLFTQLNELEVAFPGTDLVLTYELVGHEVPPPTPDGVN